MTEYHIEPQYNVTGWDRSHGLQAPLFLVCGSTYKMSVASLRARPRYSLVVDEDVKKPTQQTKKP